MSAYWATLRRQWRLAAAVVAAAVLAGVGAGLLAPKSYEATAKVLIGQRAQVDALLGAADYAPDPEREINTSLELVSLDPVAESVRRRLGLNLGTAALIDKLSARIDRNSSVVSLTVRDDSPGRAARIANAFALAVRDFLARSSQATIEDAVAAAKERASQLAPGPERDALDAEVRRLQAAGAFKTGGVQVVNRATAASASPTRNLAFNAVVAGFLGVILAAVAIVVLARTDKRVRDEEELEAAVGRPVLATVPHSLGPSSDTAERDAFASLAVSLAFRGLRWRESRVAPPNGRYPLVLLLTSPGAGEGTTAVALGLARALGEMGRRVIAIEADLRAPRFASELGLEPAAGLAGVLVGARTLDEEIVELPWEIGGGAPAAALVAGPGSPLPQPLLAGPGMAALVAEARRKADVVLIAGAPAGEYADSLALVPLADAVLLVARLDVTRRDELRRAAHASEELDERLAGAVATSGRRTRRSATRTVKARARRAPTSPGPAESAHSATNGAASPSRSTTEVTTR
jgi:Mrp family chromosome partitioning ATPase